MDEQGGHSLVIVNLASALGNEACSVGKVSQLRSSGDLSAIEQERAIQAFHVGQVAE